MLFSRCLLSFLLFTGVAAVQVAGSGDGTLVLEGCECTVETDFFIDSIGKVLAEASASIWDKQCTSAPPPLPEVTAVLPVC